MMQDLWHSSTSGPWSPEKSAQQSFFDLHHIKIVRQMRNCGTHLLNAGAGPVRNVVAIVLVVVVGKCI
jgi:hypothetical protein